MSRDEVALLLPARTVCGSRLIQRAAAQHHQHRRDAVADALVEVAGLERRGDHLVDDHRTLGVGQAIFQAVAHLDAQFTVIPGDDQQGTVVLVLLPDAPVAPELVAEVFDAGALQVRQRDHHDLFASGLLVGLELRIQLLAHRRLKQLGGIHYPPGQRRKLQLGLGRDCKHPEQQHQAKFQHTHWNSCGSRVSVRISPAALFRRRGWWPRRSGGSAGRCTSRCATTAPGKSGSRCCTFAPPG
ncbi:hypothetical protein SRABI112_05252 [Pseudomonas mediterranea]|nr:hypothetical protein SRABI112_05252 [Pseudomonas mediterranea]